MDLNLHLDKERSLPGKLALSGKIGVDATKLKALLPQEAQALARRLQIGKGYEIIGQFSFPKDSLKDALKEISFEGTLGGKDFELLGYQLKTLTAAVQYGSGALSVTGLKINDVAGELNCQAVTVEKRVEPEINKPIAQSTRQPIGQEPELEEAAQDHWMVAIPLVEVKDLRPSLLQPVDGSKTGLKPLLVDSVELKDFRGDLSDSKTFTGSGELIFSRQANKTLENPLWAIPRDVLSRLGLDSRFFVPVMGQIHYAIKDARVTFPKFKDVYSQEKKSRFYLAKGDENPYIDFDGNININFRVKQYNIILKFAELFIVSIRGTLQNPTYDLLKPPPGQAVERDENDEELAPEGK